MFLEELKKRNQRLIDYTLLLSKQGLIEPNTYVIDLDSVVRNARKLAEKAKELNIELYQMTKQFGRNPLVAQAIAKAGIEKTVCVDWKEARVLYQAGIKIGNIGHVVQVPKNIISEILQMNPEIWTIYSLENAKLINHYAKKLKVKQKIMLRVYDEQSNLYPSQEGGIAISTLPQVIDDLLKLENLEIAGVTSFPVLLFDPLVKQIKENSNYHAIETSLKICLAKGIKIEQINLPSANNFTSLNLVKKLGGNTAEPGHAFTGTTPIAKGYHNEEKPAMLYYSEVSHHYQDSIVAFAGGHYRRGHQEGALIGQKQYFHRFCPLDPTAIDYYYRFKIEQNYFSKIGDPVIMCFRSQIFVTRSQVLVVGGLSRNQPKILGSYDAQGNKLD